MPGLQVDFAEPQCGGKEARRQVHSPVDLEIAAHRQQQLCIRRKGFQGIQAGGELQHRRAALKRVEQAIIGFQHLG